jgi:hypothetical protein
MKPNFIIIGAARSGTTSLYKYLESHPDVFMSEVKEINFFSNEKYWRKGTSWYYTHFQKAKEKCIGEASTSYTNYPNLLNTPSRVYDLLPDAKLIYVLRDPINRFISHYLHRVDRGVEERNIEDIIKNHKNDFLLTQGKYYLQIKQYLKYFHKDSILLLTIEDLKNSPNETVKNIYKFLNVDDSFSKKQKLFRHNVNKKITRKNIFGRFILKIYHNNVEQVAFPYSFKKIFLILAEIGAKEIAIPTLSKTSISTLKEYYCNDIKELKALTKLNFNEWENY